MTALKNGILPRGKASTKAAEEYPASPVLRQLHPNHNYHDQGFWPGNSARSSTRPRPAVLKLAAPLLLLFICLLWWLSNIDMLFGGKSPLAILGWGSRHTSGSQNMDSWELNHVRSIRIRGHASGGNIRLRSAPPGQIADIIVQGVPDMGSIRSVGQQPGQPPAYSVHPSPEDVELRQQSRSDMTVYLRANLVLDDIHMEAESGNIEVQCDAIVNNVARIRTRAGSLSIPMFFNTRKTYIDSGSSSLQGTFKLYDLLSIHSTSGSIDITVDPQEVNEANPQPAELIVGSQSGRVQLQSAAFRVPEREYQSVIETRDASIQGSLIHGSKTIITSTSGMIDVSISPYIPQGEKTYKSILKTSSQSGRQQISVDGLTSGSLDGMISSHTSQSGALQLDYPRQWSGSLSARASSGRVEVRGQGVEVIEKGPHSVRAVKGDGNSELSMRSQSGSISLDIGF